MRLQNDRCQNSSVIDPSSVIAPAFTPNPLSNTKRYIFGVFQQPATNPFPIGNYSNQYDKLIPAKRTIIRLTYVECKVSNC